MIPAPPFALFATLIVRTVPAAMVLPLHCAAAPVRPEILVARVSQTRTGASGLYGEGAEVMLKLWTLPSAALKLVPAATCAVSEHVPTPT